MGTAVGLMLGLRAAGLKSRVVSVRVVWEKMAGPGQLVKLFQKTNSLLHSLDKSFPRLDLTEKDVDIRHDFYGGEYALFTEKGMEAVNWAKNFEGLKLEGTYTGKAMAALIDDAGKGTLKDRTVLFWNTYNSRDFSNEVSGIDYRELPECLHSYFEDEVQPLDCDL
jgi:D-cysteine desulfhydrase